MSIEERKQKPTKLLEDELGRPLHALQDDSLAAAEETFRRDVFASFESGRKLLGSHRVEDYLDEYYGESDRTPPLMLADTLSMSECIEFMRAFNVSSAPVLTGDAKTFIGWCSVFDILRDVAAAIQRAKPPGREIVRETAALTGQPHVHSAWGVLRHAFRTVTSAERLSGESVERREVELDNHRREWLSSISPEDVKNAIDEVLNMTLKEARRKTHSEEDGRMVSRVAAADADLLELVRCGFLRHIVTAGDFIAPRQAHVCHRVCTYSLKPDDKDEMKEKMVVEALVSQADIVQFLYDNSDSFDDALKRRNLTSLGLGARKSHRVFPDSDVMCVFPETRLLDAFVMMHVTGHSCLGVVDEPRGKLIDVLSVSDIREAVFDVDALCDTVERYLKSRALTRIPLVTLTEDADFIDVLGALAKNSIHHVFVVDLEGSPLRVVTPTDVLTRLALPSARKLGWRFDSYEVHPDTFENNPATMIRPIA